MKTNFFKLMLLRAAIESNGGGQTFNPPVMQNPNQPQAGGSNGQPYAGMRTVLNFGGKQIPVVYQTTFNQRGEPALRPFFTGSDHEFAELQAAQRTRELDLQEVAIGDVRKFLDRNNNPRVAFNRGSLVLSQSQLDAIGVYMPEVLIGTILLVDFFKPGEVLINRSVVTDDGILANQFFPPKELGVMYHDMQKEIAREKALQFRNQISSRRGANVRGQGSGLQQAGRNDAQAGIIQQGVPQVAIGQQQPGSLSSGSFQTADSGGKSEVAGMGDNTIPMGASQGDQSQAGLENAGHTANIENPAGLGTKTSGSNDATNTASGDGSGS